MLKYTFSLKVKGSDNEYAYSLNLTPNQENMPEQIFTPEIRENIRTNLQEQSLCAIRNSHLNKIITTWIQDIKEGYRDSTLTMSLPLLVEANLEQLNEQGNQEIPMIISPDLADIEPQLGMLPPLSFS